MVYDDEKIVMFNSSNNLTKRAPGASNHITQEGPLHDENPNPGLL